MKTFLEFHRTYLFANRTDDRACDRPHHEQSRISNFPGQAGDRDREPKTQKIGGPHIRFPILIRAGITRRG